MAWTSFAVAIALLAQPPDRAQRDLPAFPPATVALLESLDPDYRTTLTTLDEPAVWRLLHGLIGARAAQTAPALEWLARSAAVQQVRADAVNAYIALTKPQDPRAEVRRLLWEQPDTELEKRVLAEGRTALPAVWAALSAGAPSERRAAAALLGWFRDLRSIGPILQALDANPAPAIRDQLLFDLNVILLTEASSALPPPERNTLAAIHLRWLHDQLLAPRLGIRQLIAAQKSVHVLPDRIDAPFSVDLGDAAVVFSPSREAFLEAGNSGLGVAFHPIIAAGGVARVATTVLVPGRGVAPQVWISLYRREASGWTALSVPSHPLLHRYVNEPSLMPAINRNYGADHPLKMLRLDLAMERIRVEGRVVDFLPDENFEYPLPSRDLDASYVGILERYKRSDAAAVRYTAELYSARLTKQPDLDVWIDALSRYAAGTRVHALAVRILGEYVTPRFRDSGRELAGVERAELTGAALKASASVDTRLSEGQPPQPENVRSVRQWDRFGLVAFAFGASMNGGSGYSLLFERRQNEWVFLCAISTWVS